MYKGVIAANIAFLQIELFENGQKTQTRLASGFDSCWQPLFGLGSLMALGLILWPRLVPVTGNKYLRLIDDWTTSSPLVVAATPAHPTVAELGHCGSPVRMHFCEANFINNQCYSCFWWPKSKGTQKLFA